MTQSRLVGLILVLFFLLVSQAGAWEFLFIRGFHMGVLSIFPIGLQWLFRAVQSG